MCLKLGLIELSCGRMASVEIELSCGRKARLGRA